MTQPYYQDSHCQLFLGDNREVLDGIDTSGVDLLLTDPPYGVGWDTDYSGFSQLNGQFEEPSWTFRRHQWRQIEGDSDPFDTTPWLAYPQVILWGANCYSDRLPMGTWLVWDKRFKSGKSFKPSHGEAAWKKGGHGIRIFAQTWQGICRSALHPSEENADGSHPSLHPTQKPVALGVWCIHQARGVKLTMDPYAGCGSFLIAAKSLGILAIGVEIEEAYCETAAKRLERTAVEIEQLTFAIVEEDMQPCQPPPAF
jgi:DNA modification methylase